MTTSRFIIKSKARDIDDLTLELEGLTIGRSPENDLVLNHPTVSRTQAGIKDVDGEFWIFNLSDVSRVLLNGEQADKVPLVDGDVLQIGPFFLRISQLEICGNCGLDFAAAEATRDTSNVCPQCAEKKRENALFCIQCGFRFQSEASSEKPEGDRCFQCNAPRVLGGVFCLNCGVRLEAARQVSDMKPCKSCGSLRSPQGVYALVITVELQIAVRPITIDNPLSSTIFMGLPSLKGKTIVTRRGTQRFSGTALLTSFLPPEDEQAVRIFWDKRRREFGKIVAETRLKPKGKERVGKIQYNWRPTADLGKLWRKSYVSWGVIIGGSLSLFSMLLFPRVFWPGELSQAHSPKAKFQSAVALKTNSGNCLSCHGVSSMQAKCVSCHTTQNFDSSVSTAHMDAGLRCVECHGEHLGQDFRPGLVLAANCVSCHRDGFTFGNTLMRTPHGGTVGYPVQPIQLMSDARAKREWVWKGISAERWNKKNLPGRSSDFRPMEQFHLVHIQLGGQKGKAFMQCVECHETVLVTKTRFLEAPKYACQGCHSVQASLAQPGFAPACTTCHEQHGTGRDAKSSRSLIMKATAPVSTQNLPPLKPGGAQALRHEAKSGLVDGYAGFSGLAWLGVLLSVPITSFVFLVVDTVRKKSFIARPPDDIQPPLLQTGSLDLARIRAEGPSYPYPVVDPVLCIGCHACVEACPHDVLAMVNGISMPVAPDQCMEDTSCEAECPTQPKACIVLNTRKKIPPRKVPKRDQRFLTDVPGIYIIGDVAGVPLIKMAINEGTKVLDYIQEDLAKEGPTNAEHDVAIIGIGPGGLSATAMAAERKLKYLALEQEQLVSTIQNYPAGKYVFFKPDSVEARGPVPLPGVGESKELILDQWMNVVTKYDLKIHEEERCKSIKQEQGIFSISVEKGKARESKVYKARKVIIAVGNRGAPMRLGVPGEDLSIMVPGYSAEAKNCSLCGFPRQPGHKFCAQCAAPFPEQPISISSCPNCKASLQKSDSTRMSVRGGKSIAFYCVKCNTRIQEVPIEPYSDSKVKYKLSNPDDFVNKKCIVVGGGNSAIEAAVDLSGFKREGGSISFTRTNEVTLIVRSDFKGDLKLGNKINIYDCMDAGRVKVLFGAAIKEISENEVVVVNVRTKQEIAKLANDYIFALIGAEKPTKFLESMGIKIG